MPRLLLLGYFGAGNLGDDCLLADFLLAHGDWMRSRGLQVDVVSRGQALLDDFVEGANLADLVVETISQKALLARKLDIYSGVIIPGGSILQDSSSLRSLLFYLSIIRRAVRARVPVCLLHQGIGPLNNWISRWLTPGVLRQTRMLSLRDMDSYNWAQRQLDRPKSNCEIALSADPVLSGRLSATVELLPPGLSPGAYVVCAPRRTGDLPYPGEPLSEAKALGRLIKHAAELSGLPVLLAAFQEDRDLAFCEAVAAECADAARLYSVPPQALRFRGSAMVALVAHAALLIGYRLHSLVIAASHGVPAFGVDYDPKVSAFCEEMGYHGCYPAAVHEQSSFDSLSQLWAEREEVKVEVARCHGEALARLFAVEQRLHAVL